MTLSGPRSAWNPDRWESPGWQPAELTESYRSNKRFRDYYPPNLNHLVTQARAIAEADEPSTRSSAK